MMLAKIFVFVVVVVVALLDLGACSTVTCSYLCSTYVRYRESCGLFNWWQCTRYRVGTTYCYRTGLNGGWSGWSTSSVGTCSRSCGSGTRWVTYKRYCNSPAPTHCGSSCPGDSSKGQHESCNTHCCPVNGGWSGWHFQRAASCSVTCGGGTRAVTYWRGCSNPSPSCGGSTCYGSSTNVVQESCNTQKCPVHGGWSSWQMVNNGSCSVTCGKGQMNATFRRDCDNPAPQYGGQQCAGDQTKSETVACNIEECPIDGNWSSWYPNNNGSCPVTCGRGEMNVTFRRDCDSPAPQFGGIDCVGDNITTETLPCNIQECPIDGNWSSWYPNNNGSCPVTCGRGEMNVSFRRDCDSPAPQFGGIDCVGDNVMTETLPCNTQECPIDGGWSSWQQDSNDSCSATCGGGERNVTQRRNCDNPLPQHGGSDCLDDSIRHEIQACNTQPCPIDGFWSSWYIENNESCSVTCGEGQMNVTFRRDCDNPAPQYGGQQCGDDQIKSETLPCNTQECPIDGNWSSWYPNNNGSCPVTCGRGEMNITFMRDCDSPAPQFGGIDCVGDNVMTETLPCNTQECPIDGGWSSWQQDSNDSCSATCGGGERNVTQRRNCDNPLPQHGGSDCVDDSIRHEIQACNTQPCPIDGVWSSWYMENNESCSVTCGEGQMNVTFRRDCDNPAPQYGGQQCGEDQIKSETLPCNTQECPINGNWSSWYPDNNGSCPVTCGGGKMNVTYRRDCDSPAPQFGGTDCVGDNVTTETLHCSTQECPIDGNWSSWYPDNNGSCPVTCGGGEMNVTSRRDCDSPAPQFGGTDCVGDNVTTETLPCNTQECPIDGSWSSWLLESNGSCPVTCGRGEMNVTYRRDCDNPAPKFGGDDCLGDSVRTETLECNTQECPIDGGWSVWHLENNGSCSVTCGGGELNVTYIRYCDTPVPQYGGQECSGDNKTTGTVSCNNQECPIDGIWSSWHLESNGTCSVTCGGGVINVTYRRYCNSSAPQYGGVDCDGSNTVVNTPSCNTEPCPIDGNWSVWYLDNNGSCSVTCGRGEARVTYIRSCDNPVPENGGRNCTGSTMRIASVQCNMSPCPAGDSWSEWGSWHVSECSALCGGGQMTQWRDRTCDNSEPADGDRTCDGPDQENVTVACNQEECGERCPEARVTFVPHANNSSLYYQCDNGVALLMSCDVGTVWDQETNTCSHDSSQQAHNGADDNICNVSGFLPNKDDCTKFYLCVDGVHFEMSCPVGLAFNPAISTCDFPDNVSCQVSD